MIAALANWLDQGILAFCEMFPDDSFWAIDFNIRALLAIILVALICGAVGSLVVGNRMAFFSDALAHCAFAGVALGLLVGLVLRATDEGFRDYITLIMVGFGVAVGVLIAYVREKTALASDTVIGVFFAGSVGLGAIFVTTMSGRHFLNLESFLFGNPLSVKAAQLIWLVMLLAATALCLCWIYNSLVFASFNPSLAQSRRMAVRGGNYAFIILLALVINVCLQFVGTLLINALLLVPAATALNLSRNMRQLFWWSVGLSVTTGLMGQWLSWEIDLPDPAYPQKRLQWGVSGMIVVVGVTLFALSMKVGPLLRERVRKEAH